MTAPKPSLRYHPTALAIAVVYLLILIIPWILTSVLSVCPIWTLMPYSPTFPNQTFGARPGLRFMRAITFLNTVATLLSIPVIVALFARAATVLSQRSRPNETLSAKGLFALVDGRPTLERSFFNCAYVVLLALDLAAADQMGAGSDYYSWFHESSMPYQSNSMGKFHNFDDPVITEAHENLPYFVSVCPTGTSTGMLRSHASRLSSNLTCEVVSMDAFPAKCPGARPFVRSSRFNETYLGICAPGAYGVSPWTKSNTRDGQEIKEELWIQLLEGNGDLAYGRYKATYHCQANTTFGYFELPNYHIGSRPGPLLTTRPNVTGQDYFYERDNSYYTDPYGGGRIYSPLVDPFEKDPYGNKINNASGPLMMVTLALFGNQSFIAAVANTEGNYTAQQQALKSICLQNSIPFSRMHEFIDCRWEGYRNRSSVNGLAMQWITFAVKGGYYYELGPANTLRTALFFVNRATMTSAAPSQASDALNFQPRDEVDLVKPSVSTAGIALISVLFGLQALGIVLVVLYIYSRPTWTETLDSLAISRITHQLRDGGVIASMGLRPVTEKDKEPLADIDALVGIDSPAGTAANGTPEHEGSLEDDQSEITVTETDLVPTPNGDNTTSGYTPVLHVGAPGAVPPIWRFRSKNTSTEDA
ncbi:hypothetical protein B0T19DRAFT_488534 [Cercophora scortea]|uniref:Uncharacterized protein n=1 Tax=Cercophora scortea TaxID=314031 RepID=A0AAE0I2G9_9PEZI|nr:hypothetical protein B0T19DRAFT_488534 [Cercophora scortea]